MNAKCNTCFCRMFLCSAFLQLFPLAALADDQCKLPVGEYGSFAMQPDGDGHVAITVPIGGKPRLMIVDTGGAVSMLSSAVVREMNLSPQTAAWERAISARGGVTRDFVNVPSFTLGRIHLDGQRFAVWPDEDPMLSHGKASGLLAPDVLERLDVDFDFGNSTISLFSSDHCIGRIPYWSPTYASLQFNEDEDGHIIVPMTLDGKLMQVMVDTGAPGSVMTLDVAKQMFGLNAQSPGMTSAGLFPSATGQSQPYYTYRFSSLSIDGLTVKNPMVGIIPDEMSTEIPGHYRPYDLILGLRDISKLHMYIAYGEHTLYFTGSNARFASAPSNPQGSDTTAPQANTRPTVGNIQDVKIAIENEYPADYPPGAAERGEEGVALVAVARENGEYKTSLGYSSGYADLDDASLKLALQYYLSGASKGSNIIAVRWGLSRDRTVKFNLGKTPRAGDPPPPADVPTIVDDN